MPARRQLHDAIDHLPEDQVDITYRVLLAITDEGSISPELEGRILDALAEVDAGAKRYTTEEVNRELGW